MTRAHNATYVTKAFVVFLLILLAGCRSSVTTMQPQPHGLPALTPSPEPRRQASYANLEYANGNAIFDSSDDTLFAGDTLVLGSSATEPGWARYAFNLDGYQPDHVTVGLEPSSGGAAWIALPNFAKGRYDIFGPFIQSTQIILEGLPEHDYISSGGQSYVLVVTSGGASVSINFVILSYDNLNDPQFSVAGKIVDEHGTPIPGIPVSANPSFATGVTDLNGNYLIGLAAADTYTITPEGAVSNHTFAPPNKQVIVVGNETAADFVGTRVDVTGHIEDESGVGLKGVLLTLTPGGKTTLSDASGNYVLSNVANNNYTVTPLLASYSFNPASKPANVSGADVEDIDFAALGGAPTFTISGLILDGGNPVPDVAVSLEPGNGLVFTDNNGFYKFSGLSDNVTYTVSPAKGFYEFTPPVQPVPIDGASVPNQDFAADLPPLFNFTGSAICSLLDDVGVPGVLVKLVEGESNKVLQTALTDNAGNFVIPNVPNGHYEYSVTKFGFIEGIGSFTLNGNGFNVQRVMHFKSGGPTYKNSVEGLIGNSCIQCHRPDSDQAVDPPLRNYVEVFNEAGSCNARIQNGTMPPGQPLSNYSKKLFLKWVSTGAPEE